MNFNETIDITLIYHWILQHHYIIRYYNIQNIGIYLNEDIMRKIEIMHIDVTKPKLFVKRKTIVTWINSSMFLLANCVLICLISCNSFSAFIWQLSSF